MNARDLMNPDVVTVKPKTPIREVARILLTHHISAVPVVDDTGTVVGMVSEGDLVGRKKTERETKSEWWLLRLAEGESLNTEFLQHLQSPLAVAREVMSSPVLTVSEDTHVDDIAQPDGNTQRQAPAGHARRPDRRHRAPRRPPAHPRRRRVRAGAAAARAALGTGRGFGGA